MMCFLAPTVTKLTFKSHSLSGLGGVTSPSCSGNKPLVLEPGGLSETMGDPPTSVVSGELRTVRGTMTGPAVQEPPSDSPEGLGARS